MPKEPLITTSNFQHISVLNDYLLESISNLSRNQLNQGLIIDATIGGGGHSSLLLERYPQIKIIGLDRDPTAIEASKKRLVRFSDRVNIIETNFSDFLPKEKAVAIIADLGVSSPQLDIAERGFSFQLNGPLDMRMNQEKGETAAELILRLEEEELANLIYLYGNERLSRKIAKKIKYILNKEDGVIKTKDLAYSIAGCYPPKARYGRIHPATRTFQALRIAVNQELDSLDKFLKIAPDWLKSGGLLHIISFHSLEDRLVKHAFKDDSRIQRVTRKPLIAHTVEISKNPRSRSAKLRICRKK